MKILLANRTAYPTIGGVENSLRYMGRELRKLGHEVKILCFQLTADEPLRCTHEDIEIIRVPYTTARWPHKRLQNAVATAEAAIPGIMKEFSPDAVWSRSTPVGLGIRRGGYTGPLLQIFPTNAKMNCRGLYLQTHGLPWKRRLMLLGLWPTEYFLAARLERELARQCSVIAFSENMRRQLLAGFPKGGGPCHVIPPGVDPDSYSPEQGAQYFERIEKDYGIDPGEPVVLYVGRLSTAKHIPMLMDAVAALKAKAKLVLVGAGPDEARLRAYGTKLGLGERLIFAGVHRDMLPGFYAISRVSVLPTTTESFGQVYLESLAAGTPVVGFAGDGKKILTATSEIVRDGETGVVAQEVSADSLGKSIGAILSLDDRDYDAMAKEARADVQARYSWRCFVEAALALSNKPTSKKTPEAANA
ncbi:MAG: glycosyltransferase family 4 protein [Candidatus Hydrogenedentes bacterium]|nr:glycosyltransferase family 4 protein [Candidatus Hydrogenedentota bacterium]